MNVLSIFFTKRCVVFNYQSIDFFFFCKIFPALYFFYLDPWGNEGLHTYIYIYMYIYIYVTETKIALEHKWGPKRKTFIFQAPIFRGEHVSFREGVSPQFPGFLVITQVRHLYEWRGELAVCALLRWPFLLITTMMSKSAIFFCGGKFQVVNDQSGHESSDPWVIFGIFTWKFQPLRR